MRKSNLIPINTRRATRPATEFINPSKITDCRVVEYEENTAYATDGTQLFDKFYGVLISIGKKESIHRGGFTTEKLAYDWIIKTLIGKEEK